MRWNLRLTVMVGLFLALLAPLACEYFESSSDEEKIVTPPSVRDVMEDAEDLALDPIVLFERRRTSALEDLEELYDKRMDDAATDRAVERLERQHDRAISRLNNNYDQRKERLEERIERDRARNNN